MSESLVAVVMGSKSDWEAMRDTAATLTEFGVPHEARVLSAHRTPAETAKYASEAEERGLEVIIAAAGGAAHLAGVIAAHTILPVLGVPMVSPALKGLDSLLSTVQMPGGVPVGTLGIGKAGAKNAALLAVAILLLGIALAPIFPIALAAFFDRARHSSDSRFVLAVSGFGGSVFPALVGWISSYSGSLRMALIAGPATLLIMVALLPMLRVSPSESSSASA